VVSDQDLVDGRRAALGERLRVLRRHNNLTQAKLAAEAGMHRTFLTEIETARHSVTLDRPHALADAMDVTIHQLLPTDDEARAALDRAQPQGGQKRRLLILELDDEAYQLVADEAARVGLDTSEVARRALLAWAESRTASQGEQTGEE
jgi:transcriptional regulator with XRE-family HTH domain